jgi:hypothetical protein
MPAVAWVVAARDSTKPVLRLGIYGLGSDASAALILMRPGFVTLNV